MLSGCKAIAIGRTSAQMRFLVEVARKVGFVFVEEPAMGEVPTPKALINFILVHYEAGDELLSRVVETVRCGEGDIRFSPIIVIANDCTFEMVLHFVHMGIDDVISLPEKAEILAQRLTGQLCSEHLYVETDTYFGPDPRRLEGEADGDRRLGQAGQVRYYVERRPDIGTRVLRHQILSGGAPHHFGYL